MDVSSMLASAVFAMLISGVSQGTEVSSSAPEFENCVNNCVSTTRYRNNLLIVARNNQGEIFRTISLELPADARLVTDGVPGGFGETNIRHADPVVQMNYEYPVGSVCGGTPGICTEAALVRYETRAHFVIYTFTFVFNNGELVEVKVDETRITRSKLD